LIFRVYRAKNTIIQRRMPSLEKKVRELFENGDKKEIIELPVYEWKFNLFNDF